MKIDPEMLEEKNYTGTRLIEMTDPKVLEMKAELTVLAKEATPFIDEMEKITPRLDPFYTKIRGLQEELKKVQEEMAPVKAEYDVFLQKVEEIDQRASLIKNKLQPLVNDIVAPEVGEFEKASQLIEKDGKIYVEIVDEIEERVKALRTIKANHKK